MIHNDEEMVDLFNRIVNQKNPMERVHIAFEIANDLGRWVMCPSALLEQLVAKLELETHIITTTEVRHPVVDALRQLVEPDAHKMVAILKAWLEIRPMFRESLQRQLPNAKPGIPE